MGRSSSGMAAPSPELADLAAQVERLASQLEVLTSREKTSPNASPWLPLKEAAVLLHYSSPRALQRKILSGRFPSECYRRLPSPSGKRSSYLFNVERYLKTLR